ncbi:MAG: hypothetical protein ACREQY_16145 [Candidatus Binatia bacterium]
MEESSNPKGASHFAAEESPGVRLVRQTRRVRDEAGSLAHAVDEAFEELAAFLRDRLDRRPYATLGVAMSAGYVLGGGVPSFVTRSVLELGGRIAIAATINQLVRGRARDEGEGVANDPEGGESHA